MSKKREIEEVVRYILSFLLRTDDDKIIDSIGYTTEISNSDKRHQLIIKPSHFFDEDFYGSEKTMPLLPLKSLESLPILYGEPKIEYINDTVILHADIIASSYFFISRYEEMICPTVRDTHGRFIGKKSLAYRAGFIHRPLVDEYGALLRKLLNPSTTAPKEEITKILLTHDVDILAHYKNLKSVLGALGRFYISPQKAFLALKTYFGSIESDPWYVFPKLFEQAKALNKEMVESILFIKPGGSQQIAYDRPLQNIFNKHYRGLFELCKKENVKIGLHSSYAAGKDGRLINEEKAQLEKAIQQEVFLNRNHYLCSREPGDFEFLISNNITDDFSMGYADIAGFRLGTCQPTRWINPVNQTLTSLTLHSLPIMDNTFSEAKYMNMSLNDAANYAIELINQVKKHRGELILLFHNSSFNQQQYPYTSALYEKILGHLKTITEK